MSELEILMCRLEALADTLKDLIATYKAEVVYGDTDPWVNGLHRGKLSAYSLARELLTNIIKESK